MAETKTWTIFGPIIGHILVWPNCWKLVGWDPKLVYHDCLYTLSAGPAHARASFVSSSSSSEDTSDRQQDRVDQYSTEW